MTSAYSSRVINNEWEDLRFPATTALIPGPTGQPTFDTTNIGLSFAAGSTETVFFIAQLPHSYTPGSSIRPHVHWMPETTNVGDVLWRLEYEWLNNGETQSGLTTVDITPTAGGTAMKHQISGFGDIAKSDAVISSMIHGKISRVGGDASDTFTDEAILKEFDIHFQMNTPGSAQELVK